MTSLDRQRARPDPEPSRCHLCGLSGVAHSDDEQCRAAQRAASTERNTAALLAALVMASLAAISLAVWAWLSKWTFSDIDTLSSVGWIVMTIVVAIGFLAEWFQDWRMLRALRRSLIKTRAERRRAYPRGPKGK